MKPFSRRSVMTGFAAAVTAIPAIAICTGAKAAAGGDRMLELIRLYRAQVKSISDDCKRRGMEDEELDARCDQADDILAEAARSPCLTAASAIAALDLVHEHDEGGYAVYGENRNNLLQAVKDYISFRA
jgi:hypothetical protein